MDFAESTVIHALETCNFDQNKVFITGILRSALNSLLLSILENDCEIREWFESVIVQISTSKKVVTRISEFIVSRPAVLAPIAKFAVSTVKSEASISIKKSVVIGPPLPPLSRSRLSSDEIKNAKRESLMIDLAVL